MTGMFKWSGMDVFENGELERTLWAAASRIKSIQKNDKRSMFGRVPSAVTTFHKRTWMS